MHPIFKHQLPAGNLIIEGLTDLDAGRKTVPALLVSVGSPNLTRMGLLHAEPFQDAEMELYSMLHDQQPQSAYKQYNSYLRQLISFERAVHCVT